MTFVKKILLLITLSSCFALNSFAQTWTQTSAPNNSWVAVASSANGMKLMAGISSGRIYVSTNYGINWTQTIAPNANWISIASSADGTKIFAAANGGGIYSSTNSGSTWVSNNVVAIDWESIACSADANTVAAAAFDTSGNPAHIFISHDRGLTWAVSSNSPTNNWYAIALSADGKKLIAAGGIIIPFQNYNRQIYISTNSGIDWRLTGAPSNQWQALAMSADGTKLVGAVYSGVIFTSPDSGNTWISNNMPDDSFHHTAWNAVTSSADGTKLAAACQILGNNPPAPIYSSINSGATWTSNNIPGNVFYSIATSADGNRLIAVDKNHVWISQSVPSPSMNAAVKNKNLKLSWIIPSTNFVLQSSADLSSWTDLTNQPVLNLTNLQNEVTLPLSASNSFYRLKTP